MLAFELGEIYAALLEMKSARIEDKLEQDAGGCLCLLIVVSSRTTCHLSGCRAHMLTHAHHTDDDDHRQRRLPPVQGGGPEV